MRLSDWLAHKGMRPSELARKIKRPPSAISRAMAGKGVRLDFVQKIHMFTGGSVSLFDWPHKRKRK